jgi:hypothetical protein
MIVVNSSGIGGKDCLERLRISVVVDFRGLEKFIKAC